MKNNISPDFRTPHFKAILQQYERARQEGGSLPYLESDDLLLLAEYYATQGEYDKGDEVVDHALSLHPDNPDVQTFKCGNLMAQGKLDQAEQLLNLQNDQNDREVLLLRAQLLLNRSQPEGATRCFDQLYRQEQTLDTILDIVDVCLDCYSFDLAKEWIDVAYAEAPHHPDVLEIMVDYLHSSGNDSQLPPFLNELIDLYPYESRYWKNLAHAYMSMNELAKAHDAIDFALTIEEKDPIAHQIKGAIYLLENKAQSAVPEFLKTEEYSTDKAVAWTALMQCYHYLKDYDNCWKYAKLAFTLPSLTDYDKSNVYHKLADCQLKMGNMETAYRYLKTAQELDPENYQVYLTWGELMFRCGQPQAAEIQLYKAVQMCESTDYEIDTLETAAHICLETEQWKTALDLYNKVDELDAESGKNNYLSMAYCCYKLRMAEQTIIYLNNAALDAPDIFDFPAFRQMETVDPEFFRLAEKIRKRGPNRFGGTPPESIFSE